MTAKFEATNIKKVTEATFEEIAFRLDDNGGSVGLRVEVLEDIAQNLKHLQADMDQAVHDGREKYSFREHHREVRILSELMFYVMQELTKDHEETRTISGELISKVKELSIEEDE